MNVTKKDLEAIAKILGINADGVDSMILVASDEATTSVAVFGSTLHIAKSLGAVCAQNETVRLVTEIASGFADYLEKEIPNDPPVGIFGNDIKGEA